MRILFSTLRSWNPIEVAISCVPYFQCPAIPLVAEPHEKKMRLPSLVIRLLICLVFLFQNSLVRAAPDGLIRTANQATEEYRKDIERLAQWAEQQGLQAEANQSLDALMPNERDKVFIPTFPLNVGTLDLPRGLPGKLPKESDIFSSSDNQSDADTENETDVQETSGDEGQKPTRKRELTPKEIWQIQFRSLRQNYAKRLFILARRAAKDNRGTLAMQIAKAGLQADPDHQGLRTVFGFVKFKNQWRTAWETERLKKGFVDHETFGWIPQKAVERYEKGERYCNGKWVDAEEAARIHGGDIKKGWKIESEHYDLMTNHSLEEGVRLVRQLENCYRAWKLLFFRYMADDAQLASLFDGKATSGKLRRHRIVIYRNREDFKRNIQAITKSDAELIAGVYMSRGGEGACHFYAVDPGAPDWQRQNVVRTMFHEATHQLFAETRKAVTNYGKDSNYWVIEGVAEYMESLQRLDNGYYVLGDDRRRVLNALGRKDKEKLLSFAELVRVNGNRFKGHLTKGDSLYEQSAAVFFFLFNHDDGEWRDAMTVYLRAVYDGKNDASTLQKLLGTSYDELDKLFEKFAKGE